MGPSPSENKIAETKERRRPGRVPTSCAECRRLKLRCDRKVPCETCVKRGCGAICPNGSLTAGKGNRLVLANTEELHNQIEILLGRVRELEDALQILSAESSPHIHPLLQTSTTDLLKRAESSRSSNAGGPSPSGASTSAAQASSETAEGLIDAFGTLTIGTRGETVFIGGTARAEYLLSLSSFDAIKPHQDIPFPRLSKQIIDIFRPDDDAPMKNLHKSVFDLLPPLSEAIRLCEIYLDYGRILWSPVAREELFDEILTSIYRAESYEALNNPHCLCLLFAVFALASLFDLNKPPCCVEAQEYHILSRISLKFVRACEHTTVHNLHCILHMIHFLELSDMEMDPSRSWILVGSAVKLGYRLGLHLHGARWKLSDTCIQRRNTVFWEIFRMDTWMSFFAGRPPAASLTWTDCGLPKDTHEVIGEDGQKEMSYHIWFTMYTKFLHEVMATAMGPTFQPYTAILNMDRKIRDFPVPSHLRPRCSTEQPVITIDSMQRHYCLVSKEAALLNLHRPYFAQALQEQPKDLLKHRYGPSVMAAYRSAWRLIESHKHMMGFLAKIIERVNLYWSHSLSAAVVMCMLVTRAPTCSMVVSSLRELDTVQEVFEASAPTSRPANMLVDTIRKLRQKGHDAVNSINVAGAAGVAGDGSLASDELDRVGGGRTRLISKMDHYVPTSSSPPTTSSPSSLSSREGESLNACPSAPTTSTAATSLDPPVPVSSGVVQAESSQGGSVFHDDSIHPRIMEDMRVFDVGSLDPFGINADLIFRGSLDSDELFLQAMSDVQFSNAEIYSNEMFSAPPSGSDVSHGGGGQPSSQSHHPQSQDQVMGVGSMGGQMNPFMLGYGAGPSGPFQDSGGPVLDASWQSFVEQLGF